MGAVRLGKISLRWCGSCNLPIVELERCGKCGGETAEVKITPPGDYRPAFDFDIQRIRGTVDRQFGDGIGIIMIPEGHLVVLNKCPGVDAMDEVIVGGQVCGTHMFEPGKCWKFICRLEGAFRISEKVTKGWVRVYDDAVPFIKNGASTMAVGVLDAHPDIKIGDEVITIAEDGTPFSTGRARMCGPDMIELKRGPAVKTRWYKEVEVLEIPDGGRTWKEAVEANAPMLDERVETAKSYILRTAKRFSDLPAAVSYSGGKDSLATLHLVLETGMRPKIIFIDTGLEFPETVENVMTIVKKFDLELLVEDAGDAFWNAIKYFGPPAKDFRWCCKTCKLGPTAGLIRKHFPEGVLSFIGQRQYESIQRFEKGSIWRNPWVPGQVGSSPIQRWPSMLIWLYIFSKDAEYNPLYEKGLERIGCWLCPAADLAEFDTLDEHSTQSSKWKDTLETFADEHDLPEEWVTLGLWRWKELPKGITDYLEIAGMSEIADKCSSKFNEKSREEGGLSSEEKERANAFSVIIGESENTQPVIMKALHCVGCGICISVCENDALRVVSGRVEIDPEKCVSCGKCIHPCPVVDFLPRC